MSIIIIVNRIDNEANHFGYSCVHTGCVKNVWVRVIIVQSRVHIIAVTSVPIRVM